MGGNGNGNGNGNSNGSPVFCFAKGDTHEVASSLGASGPFPSSLFSEAPRNFNSRRFNSYQYFPREPGVSVSLSLSFFLSLSLFFSLSLVLSSISGAEKGETLLRRDCERKRLRSVREEQEGRRAQGGRARRMRMRG